MPLAFEDYTHDEVAVGINFAANNGAHVISMSFGNDTWDTTIIDPAIENASNNDLVMCVATHNNNNSITYPSTNPLVMACGASDKDDNRKTPTSADPWGSDFGLEMSVVAPGLLIPTRDRQGPDGYEPGDYKSNFFGTSAATPQVAGLAALIKSLFPTFTNDQIRERIERNADKVGTVAYSITADHPNGTWYPQACGFLKVDHRIHSPFEKSIIERTMQYIKDRTECFDNIRSKFRFIKKCVKLVN
jgi:subtilisin family serine protease